VFFSSLDNPSLGHFLDQYFSSDNTAGLDY